MVQFKQKSQDLLALLMQELRKKSGATIRGVRREARMGQSTIYSCLCGETN